MSHLNFELFTSCSSSADISVDGMPDHVAFFVSAVVASLGANRGCNALYGSGSAIHELGHPSSFANSGW
jgi:hypothetical protein